ncbi:uncharacterized protein LOC125326775 [Corvus hawaiiensis]|uniref:uncharacterized protein LOC125326775 n=1 Tax=Corvus hawaiiensis TaxID=134902 RepID=UPI0020184052|nr:uncharacterized protein LOC125326775 [Corvus hawaiiensis]
MAFAPSEHDIASRLAPSAAERSASRRGRGRQGCSLLPSSRCIYLRGLRLLSPFWRRSAMQAGRYLGNEEGILGSCSVVRKIMSVPCGAVSGDRSQMQSLLYGRLSFSAENSLPPSQTSSKTFSRYCGSLRLKRGEKGGKKGFSSLLPLSSSRRISLGCAGGHAMPLCTRGPSHPRPAENPSPNTGTVVQKEPVILSRGSSEPQSEPDAAAAPALLGGTAAAGAFLLRWPSASLGTRLREYLRRICIYFFPEKGFSFCIFCLSQVSDEALGSPSSGLPRTAPYRGALEDSFLAGFHRPAPGYHHRAPPASDPRGGAGRAGRPGGDRGRPAAPEPAAARSPRGSRGQGESRLPEDNSWPFAVFYGEEKQQHIIIVIVIVIIFIINVIIIIIIIIIILVFLSPRFKIFFQTSMFSPLPPPREKVECEGGHRLHIIILLRGGRASGVNIRFN